jgi:hypothetical protein
MPPPSLGDSSDGDAPLTDSPAGYLDSVINDLVKGWAVNTDDPDNPAMLDVVIDDEVIGETTADQFRDDLQRSGIRDGYAGFSFVIPLNYYDGQEHRVSIVLRHNREALRHCPLAFSGTAREMPVIRKQADWAERTVLLRRSRRAELLPERARRRGKIALLSTYHSAPKFLGYHYALARMLTDVGFVVLILHAAGSSSNRLDDIDRDDCFLFVKRNLGYDFGSWAVGTYALADLLEEVEEIILINDSVIFLLPDLSGVLQEVRKQDADLVGLTDSYQQGYHLQSYFLWFGPRICRSSLLRLFMAKYSFSSNKETAIKEGEIGLSRFFQAQGFVMKALHPYERIAGSWLKKVPQIARSIESLPAFDLSDSSSSASHSYRSALLEKLGSIASSVVSGIPMNPVHYFWDVLVMEYGYPFLKRELVLLNPGEVPTYFELSTLLGALSPDLQSHVMEVRQHHGGNRVPFMIGSPELRQIGAGDGSRMRKAKGHNVVS